MSEALLGLDDLFHLGKILAFGSSSYFLSTGVIRRLLVQSMDRERGIRLEARQIFITILDS